MIIIKKKILLYIELIDGTTQKFSFEDKDCLYGYNFNVNGYHISLNKLGEAFNDDRDRMRYREELFFPYTSIKMVRKQIEYQIEKWDVFILIERHCKRNRGITYANIKKTLVGKGVILSEEDLKAFLTMLEDEKQIIKYENDSDLYVTKAFSDMESGEGLYDTIRSQPQKSTGLSCGDEKKKKFANRNH